MPSMTSEAEPIVQRAAAVYQHHTRPWFIGLLVHGSAVKGGFIPGCSDVDFQLFLKTGAFGPTGHLPLELGLAIHRDLAAIDPAPFGYIQCYAVPAEGREDFTGPIPGAYQILAGSLPVKEATGERLRENAQAALNSLQVTPPYIAHGLLEHGDGRLAANVRLLCTDVWPTLYNVLIMQGGDGIAIWNLRKDQAIEHLPTGTPIDRAIRAFDRAVRAYYPEKDSVEEALNVVNAGVHFLYAAGRWWENR